MTHTGDTAVAPLLRWAGSKRAHLGFFEDLTPKAFRQYVEPFAGSAALFFRLAPRRAVLGDLNSELINTYHALRADPNKVHALLSAFEVGAEAYYRIRAWEPDTDAERAARFLYLNRFCFNGLYRTNRAGRFNVPYGRPKNFNRLTLDHIEACARLLRRATLAAGDFRSTLSKVGRDDFVYLDPPYATTTRRTFVEYQRESFSAHDAADVAAWLRTIHEKGALFLLSYAYTTEARKLFYGWEQRRLSVHRNVAGFSGARRKQYELIVSNMTLPK